DGDSVFDTDDRFLFWALAPYGWASQYDPAQPRTEFIENFYTDETVYWITWGGSFSDSPHRMSTRSVSDDTATEFATTAPWRLHYEQNNAENFRYRDEDGWIWEDLRGRGTDRLYLLDAPNVASGDGILTARLMSHDLGAQRTVELKIGTTPITFWQWCHGANTALYDVTGCFENMLTNGTNSIRINANTGNASASDQIYTAWFDLEYERTLRAESGRRLLFFADEVMPSLPNPPAVTSFCTVAQPAEVCPTPPANLVYGQTAFQLAGFDAAPADIHLFDVSDQHDVVELTDFNVLGNAPHDVRFSDPGLTGTRWYTAVTMNGVRSLEAGEVAQLRGLRSTQNGADYAVVYHPDFEAGAERLAELRARPTSFDNLTTVAIDINDIYQEFSWGMRDPLAVRDFLAWTVVGWAGGAPFYVALLGDSAYDTKGFLPGSPEDLVSTYTQRYRISSTQYVGGDNLNFYSTDDFFGYLEPEDFDPQLQPGLEAAIGRFPVQTTAELDLMLDKLDTYLSYSSPGLWQNRVVLVADDERTLSDTVREPFHTTQVEELAETWFPDSIDPVKIYLVNYPRNTFGKKPEAQAAFIEEFTRGALHTSYTGHGDASTMAQEEVFVSQKIPEILNEDRYTIFSTFSCTVSRFDLLSGDSMTELLLKYPEGGAVTTFASGGLVFPVLSSELNQQWLSGIYGTPYVIPTDARTVRPIGQAAVAAKAVVNTSGNATRNSEKYVTLGDPALRPRFGSEQIRFDPATVDSQATDGLLRRIDGYVIDEQSGLVLDGTNGTTAFSGQAWVHVTELPNDRGYDYTDANGTPQHIDFTLDGPTAFRGTVPVVNGRFTAKFFLGEGITPGNTGRISVFGLEDAGSGGVFRDASGAYEALVLAPTISPSQVPDDLEGPRVTIRFEGYDRFVDGDQVFTDKPVLVVELEDPSGINLRPFPQFARLEAEIDGSQRIDLASDFSYDDAEFTQGRVRRIMPMAPGKHTLEVKAFDNVNNRGTDRVEFEIVLADAEFDLVDDYVAVYPNPFRSRTDFLYRLTQDADVEFLVYTITGRRVWELTTRGVAGDNVIRWNGRDSNGSPVANGTYLFKMKARYTDTEGAIERDEYVGKVVRMQ
ncbi:MAG: hypothetical protein KC591_17630, partial [Gemmatimonadetes bacterium]|nr:hypothetical protein [Gemmatimonadota bacterium]